MKKVFLLLTVSLLFASCKSYIQIYDVDSTSAKTSNLLSPAFGTVMCLICFIIFALSLLETAKYYKQVHR